MSNIENLIRELRSNGIFHPAVLNAIKEVPRERFLPKNLRNFAYDNTSLPIDCRQTISQPYIVAIMTQYLLQFPTPKKILEIGTGSGYQAAILAKIFKEVWTVERIKELHEKSKKKLNELGFNNIHFKLGDGTQGWSEAAPFDGIIVTAAAETLPQKLIEQLNPEGGLMIIPVGGTDQIQKLMLIEKEQNKIKKTELEPVRFVPLIGDIPDN